ncbi:hypothetical protein MUP46_02430 [Patescibacteria group bacterium]|nr:hypothetical protein [Patescibacteria group bacterium]
MPKTECHCPNCNGPAMREGDEITCEKCDVIFIVKQKEVKVKQIGTIEDLSERVQRLEDLVPGQRPPKKDEPGPKPKEDEAEDGEGFIVGHGR